MMMFAELLSFIWSVIASKVLKSITPIALKDRMTGSCYKVSFLLEGCTYDLNVQQWIMCLDTRIKIFNSCTRYYEVTVTCHRSDGIVLSKRYYPAPIHGLFSSTKLPHVIIAILTKSAIEASLLETAS